MSYDDYSEKFCGDTVPEAITSSGSSMVVKFHSDGSRTGAGFRAVWEEITITTLPPCVPSTCDAASCLTYPNTDNYPCSQYSNNDDEVSKK